MRRSIGKILLFTFVALVACSIAFYLYSLHSYYRSDVSEPPESGQWKNDDLNIILDFNTGDAVLYLGQERVICNMQTEYNAPLIFLVVDPLKNDAECSVPKDTVTFSGNFEEIEKDRLCIREDKTNKLYWFYLIDGDN